MQTPLRRIRLRTLLVVVAAMGVVSRPARLTRDALSPLPLGAKLFHLSFLAAVVLPPGLFIACLVTALRKHLVRRILAPVVGLPLFTLVVL